jgi:hypothetical protein
VQFLIVSKIVAPLPYWQMCVWLCLGGNITSATPGWWTVG